MHYLRSLVLALTFASCSQSSTTALPEVPTGYLYKIESALPGKTIYVCGQRPFDSQGSLVGSGNLGLQARQVFDNVKTSLATVNMTLKDVTQIKYLIKETDTTAHVSALKTQAIKAVEATYFTQVPSIIEMKAVSQTIREDVLIEVEVIAVK